MKKINKNPKPTMAELNELIGSDFRCTCNTYKDGFTDENLYNELFQLFAKHNLNPTITAETLKLALITVLEMKYNLEE